MMSELKTGEKYIFGGENNFSYQTAPPPIGKFIKEKIEDYIPMHCNAVQNHIYEQAAIAGQCVFHKIIIQCTVVGGCLYD